MLKNLPSLLFYFVTLAAIKEKSGRDALAKNKELYKLKILKY